MTIPVKRKEPLWNTLLRTNLPPFDLRVIPFFRVVNRYKIGWGIGIVGTYAVLDHFIGFSPEARVKAKDKANGHEWGHH